MSSFDISTYWAKQQLSSQHYRALRNVDIKKLIEEGVFSVDRFTRLSKFQIHALVSSEGLRSDLIRRKITAPQFLRYSPNQLNDLVTSYATVSTIL